MSYGCLARTDIIHPCGRNELSPVLWLRVRTATPSSVCTHKDGHLRNAPFHARIILCSERAMFAGTVIYSQIGICCAAEGVVTG